MSRIFVLGATGSLGKHVVEQAVVAGHHVTVLVRTPSRLPADLRKSLTVHQANIVSLSASQLAALVRGHDALINTAGNVGDGQSFVALVDHIVTSMETLPESGRPVCWFTAGAAVLDIGDSGRKAVDVPLLRKTYWPHLENFNRLQRSSLDWRLLCPGPLVEGPPVGITRLRISSDCLPVEIPVAASSLPDDLLLPIFGQRMREMVLPYADAAALMLSNLQPASAMSRHRIGLALPIRMNGKRER